MDLENDISLRVRGLVARMALVMNEHHEGKMTVEEAGEKMAELGQLVFTTGVVVGVRECASLVDQLAQALDGAEGDEVDVPAMPVHPGPVAKNMVEEVTKLFSVYIQMIVSLAGGEDVDVQLKQVLTEDDLMTNMPGGEA